MPTWEGIEDASSTPTRIWLWRNNDAEKWKPLRKSDCRALNNNDYLSTSTLIEGGRATAFPQDNVIKFNFDSTSDRQLTSATWFLKTQDPKSKDTNLVPLSSHDACQTESLYQEAVAATSSLGQGIDGVLKQERILEDEQSKVVVIKTGSTLTMKKKPTGWFGTSYDLQRGYGPYEIPGEAEEESLGDIGHLVFVRVVIVVILWRVDGLRSIKRAH